jgi:hypothetical protein
MNGEMRERVLAFARERPAPTRVQMLHRQLLVTVSALLWSVAVLSYCDGVRLAPRPGWLLMLTGGGATLFALTSLWAAAGRGASMLGRSRAALMAVVLGVPLALFAWKVGFTACADEMSREWPGRWGFVCFRVAMVSGVAPFVALMWWRRGGVMAGAPWVGAAIGLTAGATAWVINDLRCEVGHVTHVLIGHVAPLPIFMVAGVLASYWLTPRWR